MLSHAHRQRELFLISVNGLETKDTSLIMSLESIKSHAGERQAQEIFLWLNENHIPFNLEAS